MKPSEKQLEGLQNYLKGVLNYRESYEEIYDHILSAIENLPDDLSFETAVNDIIKRDFGGHDNLEKVEQGIRAGVDSNTRKLFKAQFRSLISFKFCFWVLIAGMLSYYIITFFGPSATLLKSVVVGLASIPSLIALLRLFNLGYIGGQRGLYASDKSIISIAFLPVYISYSIMIWLPMTFAWLKEIWKYDDALTVTCIIIAWGMYNAAFIKFYRSELNSLLVVNG